jgi:hypothetical protein
MMYTIFNGLSASADLFVEHEAAKGKVAKAAEE